MLARLRTAVESRVAGSRKLQAAHDFMVAAALLDLYDAISDGERDPQRIAECVGWHFA